ncbi:hypothetical protein STXM2123_3304 [Streptomyces sp. F-3]|nr:hypothetical protein STXM2123_3304 [Streptomyces sp. F-3]
MTPCVKAAEAKRLDYWPRAEWETRGPDTISLDPPRDF